MQVPLPVFVRVICLQQGHGTGQGQAQQDNPGLPPATTV